MVDKTRDELEAEVEELNLQIIMLINELEIAEDKISELLHEVDILNGV